MKQSRTFSFIEGLANGVAGFFISLALTYWVMPWFGLRQSVSISLCVVLIYTLFSILRSWGIRRLFNSDMIKKYDK